MNRRWILLMLTVLVLLLITACTTSREAGPPILAERSAPNIKEGVKTAEKEAWEVAWEKVTREAKKEGVVVVYSSSVGPAIKEASPILNKKYGLRVDLISGRGAELTQRLISERKAGLYLADVLLTGMNNFAGETKPAGAADILDPALILPEADSRPRR